MFQVFLIVILWVEHVAVFDVLMYQCIGGKVCCCVIVISRARYKYV